MEFSEISSFIQSVGFPIGACIIMFILNHNMQKTLSNLSETLSLMSERLKNVEDAIKKGE